MSMNGYYKNANEDEFVQLQEGELSAVDFMMEESLSIGGVWHVLHYAITGSAEESDDILSKAVIGGEPLNEDDLGYGPILYCSKEDTKAVFEALKNKTHEDLDKNLESDDLYEQGVYLAEYVEEDKDAIYDAFDEVKALFKSAVEKDEFVLFCIM